MANVLQTAGNASGAALYNAAADAGRLQFHTAYWHDDNGTYGSGSATALVLPLALNATPEPDRHAAELALLARLDADGFVFLLSLCQQKKMRAWREALITKNVKLIMLCGCCICKWGLGCNGNLVFSGSHTGTTCTLAYGVGATYLRY